MQRLVRETGLEPVRCKPHAPQTCASASSATLASCRFDNGIDYTRFRRNCQGVLQKFFWNFQKTSPAPYQALCWRDFRRNRPLRCFSKSSFFYFMFIFLFSVSFCQGDRTLPFSFSSFARMGSTFSRARKTVSIILLYKDYTDLFWDVRKHGLCILTIFQEWN